MSEKAPSFVKEAKLTLFLAVPMMAGQLSQMLMGVADTIMVGRVGVIALAAASLATVVLHIAFVSGLGFQVPISILAAQAHGRSEARESGEVLRHGLAIGAFTGLIVATMVTVVSYYLHFLGQQSEVVTLAGPFLRILAWSLLPAMIEQGLKQFCDALHRPWAPMAIMLSAVGLNVFLNWVLIYGNLGAPALGLEGAGWATLTARIVSVVAMFGLIFCDKNYRVSLPQKWFSRLEKMRIGRMLKMGVPVSASLLLEVAAFGAAAIMMGWLGAKSLAAHQIAINCAATTFMCPLGLSFATRIRVGHAVGRGHFSRLPRIGFSAMGLSVIIMGCSALTFLFFGSTIAGWFVKDEEVVAIAASLLLIAGVFQIFDGLQVVGSGSLNGLGDVRAPMVTSLVAYWLIALPLAWQLTFRHGYGGAGIWWAMATGLACAAMFGIWRFQWLSRKMARQ